MVDDYKDEYLLRLQKSLIYETLKIKCQDKDTEVITLVDSAISYAFQRTKTIIKHMGEFTLHDGDHLFRVLKLMEKILSENTIKNLSSPELMLLVLSAFFHDIGMAPDEKNVIAWKKNWDSTPEFSDDKEEKAYNEFKRFYSAKPDQNEIINRLIEQGKYTNAETIKSYLITEFIRQTHAERAREIIDKDWNGKILFRDTDLTVEFAQICFSHNDDALSLLELDKNFLCGSNNYACLPLIGIILRLSDILDFDAKRTPPVLYSHLYVRHPISISEWSKHRAVEAWEINPDLIQFNAKCKHPAIESSIHAFCDLIDHELSLCNNMASILNEFNKNRNRDILIKFPFKVNREKIRTETDIRNKPKYIYRNTQFNLSKRQVIDLLMGTKLYGNPEVALRELLQNSIDACLLRAAQELKWNNKYLPEIKVKYYSEDNENVLEIEDNGTGMDQYIIDNYYSKVGSSFYKSTDFYNLKSESKADFTPTSRFGIGILSCFMVADTLIVETKRVLEAHKSSDALNVTVEGQESIFWIKDGKRTTPGTTTKLILRKKQNPWEVMSDESFIKSVENLIPNPPFKIHIKAISSEKIIDENSFNEITVDSIKDYTWEDNENIKTFNISINRKDIGILGSAKVAILERRGKPVKSIELNSRTIEIEGDTYTLEKKIRLAENLILENSKSITISDDGQINIEDTSREFTRSTSRLSFHGIEVPSTLFPDFWRRKENQVKISWPFPILLVIDILGHRDLDLNSSRTEIIMSEKWVDFEEQLALIICTEISKSVSSTYWKKLKYNLIESTKNEAFLRSINKISG